MKRKMYFILINTAMAYEQEYKLFNGETIKGRKIGAVISRHHTMKAALRARAYLNNSVKTDIVRLPFMIGYDDYVAEAYCGANGYRFQPTSCLISQ